MPKKKEQKFNEKNRPVRKSEFDPEREAFMSKDGGYTYNQWVQQPNGLWELKPTCTINIGEDEVTSEVTIVLDDMDCADDRANNQIRKHRDKVFEEQRAAYEADPTDENGDKRVDPWDKASYQAMRGTDILDQIFPENKPTDTRMEKLLELMAGLTEEQRDLIYDHLGARKQFTQIAAEESERKGKTVTRQAISNRWDRILAKLCKGFNVPKPVRRKDKDNED